MNEWVKVNQVAEKVGIPAETVRRYARQYGDYLRMKKGEKRSYLIHETSLDTIKKIRYLLEQGKQREQVNEILQQTEILTVQMDDEEMNEYLMTLPQLHRETDKQMKKLSEQIDRQNELIMDLTQQLGQQQEYIKESLNRRDRELLQAIRESIQLKLEKKKTFWQRFFGK